MTMAVGVLWVMTINNYWMRFLYVCLFVVVVVVVVVEVRIPEMI